MSKVNYFVDENSRKCICVIAISSDNPDSLKGSFKGVAKCSLDDTFDVSKGCELAYVRALLKLKKAEVKFHQQKIRDYHSVLDAYNKHIDSENFNIRRICELQEELQDLLDKY